MKKLYLLSIAIFLIIFTGCNNGNSIPTYTITYNSEYGTVPDEKKVEGDSILYGEELPELTSDHAEFIGWFLENEQIVAGEYLIKSDITLTAKWKVDQCFISFKADAKAEDSIIYHYNYNQEILMPGCLFDLPIGYKFAGWALEEEKNTKYIENDKYVVVSNVTFTAVWIEKDSWAITYKNVEENEILQTKNVFSFKENESIRLYSISREGYKFNGWFENEDFSGTPITTLEAGTKKDNVVLYASFSPITYYVQYYVCNDDTYYMSASGSMSKQTFVYGQEQKLEKNAFSIPGMKFYRWTTNPQETKATYKKDASVNYFEDEQIIKSDEALNNEDGAIVKLYAFFVDNTPPVAPTRFRIYERKKDSIELKWENPIDISNIDRIVIRSNEKIFNNKSESVTFVKESGILKNSLLIQELEMGNLYEFELYTVDEFNNYSTAVELNATTRYTDPSDYTTFKTKDEKDDTECDSIEAGITILWSTPSKLEAPDFDKFSITYRVEGSEEDKIPEKISDDSCYIKETCGSKITVKFDMNEKADESGFTNTRTFIRDYFIPMPIVEIETLTPIEDGFTIVWKDTSKVNVNKKQIMCVNEKNIKTYIDITDENTKLTGDSTYTTEIKVDPMYYYTVRVKFNNESIYNGNTITACSNDCEHYPKYDCPIFSDGIHCRIGYIYYTDGTCYHCNKVEKTPHGVVYATTEDLKPKKIVSFKSDKKVSSDYMSYWYDASWDGVCYSDNSFSCPDLEELENIYNMRDILNNSNVRSIQSNGVIPVAQYAVIVSSTLYNNYRYFIREDNGRAISDYANTYSSNGSINARGYKDTFPDNYRSSVNTAYAIFVKDVSQN